MSTEHESNHRAVNIKPGDQVQLKEMRFGGVWCDVVATEGGEVQILADAGPAAMLVLVREDEVLHHRYCPGNPHCMGDCELCSIKRARADTLFMEQQLDWLREAFVSMNPRERAEILKDVQRTANCEPFVVPRDDGMLAELCERCGRGPNTVTALYEDEDGESDLLHVCASCEELDRAS